VDLLNNEQLIGAECANDAVKSSELLLNRLRENEQQLASAAENSLKRCELLLDNGYIQLDLDKKTEAWEGAHDALKIALQQEDWPQAVQACDIIYKSEQDDAIKAIAHGIWLGVTYPVDPELSVTMLQHLIEETPDKSDGAAVAAAVASYLVELRADDAKRDELKFFTNQLLGQVARRHSNVDEQAVFDFWIERMELDDPGKFIPRLAQILDVLMENEQWWFDRDALREKLPDDA
jgi:hypothetical protein